jgi:hypothetical protein
MTPPDTPTTDTTDTTIAHGPETVERQLRVARALRRRRGMKNITYLIASDFNLPEPIAMTDVPHPMAGGTTASGRRLEDGDA